MTGPPHAEAENATAVPAGLNGRTFSRFHPARFRPVPPPPPKARLRAYMRAGQNPRIPGRRYGADQLLRRARPFRRACRSIRRDMTGDTLTPPDYSTQASRTRPRRVYRSDPPATLWKVGWYLCKLDTNGSRAIAAPAHNWSRGRDPVDTDSPGLKREREAPRPHRTGVRLGRTGVAGRTHRRPVRCDRGRQARPGACEHLPGGRKPSGFPSDRYVARRQSA